MKNLSYHSQKTTHRYLYQNGPEGPRGPETTNQGAPKNVESSKDFIDRHNRAINDHIAKIPVPDGIKGLCHDRLGGLICQAADPEFNTNNGRIQQQLSDLMSEGQPQGVDNPPPTEKKTPGQREAEQSAAEKALVNYLKEVAEASRTQRAQAQKELAESGDNDPKKLAHLRTLEQRSAMMDALADTIDAKGLVRQDGVPFGGNEALVGEAEGTLGINEGAEASSLVGLDTVSTPWCGAYTKTMIEKSGNTLPEGPNWNVAETYVKQPSAAGQHVAIYIGNGMMIGGNQSNAVTKSNISGNYRFNTVENLMNGVHADLASTSEPQPGDIIVTSRTAGNSDPNATGPQ